MAPSPTGAQRAAIPVPTPETPYFNLTPALQAFYAARGLWSGSQPQGWLAGALLGPMGGPACYWYVSPSGLRQMRADMAEHGYRGMKSQAVGQHLSRMREALRMAGEEAPAVSATHQRGDAPVPGPDVAPANPFAPLAIPARGRARDAFIKHCFDSVRELVDFQQTGEYPQGGRQ